jgi:hypothetical protein
MCADKVGLFTREGGSMAVAIRISLAYRDDLLAVHGLIEYLKIPVRVTHEYRAGFGVVNTRAM